MTITRSGTAATRRTVLGATFTAAVASVLTGCRPSAGAARTAPPAGSAAVSLGKVGILTADIDRSLGFYRRLGLDVPGSVDGDTYYRLPMPADTVLFWEAATAVGAFDPTYSLPPPANRRIALEFGFASPDALEATFRELVAAGAPTHLPPFDLGGGIRYAIVEDPDGNQISLRYPAVS